MHRGRRAFFFFNMEMDKDTLTLPWNVYNEHFKIIKIIDDHLNHLKYEVKCLHCIRSKSLTADTRSPSNLKKHLTVSTIFLYLNLTYILLYRYPT